MPGPHQTAWPIRAAASPGLAAAARPATTSAWVGSAAPAQLRARPAPGTPVASTFHSHTHHTHTHNRDETHTHIPTPPPRPRRRACSSCRSRGVWLVATTSACMAPAVRSSSTAASSATLAGGPSNTCAAQHSTACHDGQRWTVAWQLAATTNGAVALPQEWPGQARGWQASAGGLAGGHETTLHRCCHHRPGPVSLASNLMCSFTMLRMTSWRGDCKKCVSRSYEARHSRMERRRWRSADAVRDAPMASAEGMLARSCSSYGHKGRQGSTHGGSAQAEGLRQEIESRPRAACRLPHRGKRWPSPAAPSAEHPAGRQAG